MESQFPGPSLWTISFSLLISASSHGFGVGLFGSFLTTRLRFFGWAPPGLAPPGGVGSTPFAGQPPREGMMEVVAMCGEPLSAFSAPFAAPSCNGATCRFGGSLNKWPSRSAAWVSRRSCCATSASRCSWPPASSSDSRIAAESVRESSCFCSPCVVCR